MNIKTTSSISNILSNARTSCLTGNVDHSDVAYIDLQLSAIYTNPLYTDTRSDIIVETRSAYKALGKEPSRYRPSAEALRRRLKNNKGLYRVGNVVDTINVISILTGYSIGAFDLDKIEGQVYLDVGSSAPYEAIGRGYLNIQNLPALRDDVGFFGTPTSDSERTKITTSTTSLLVVFYDFYQNEKLAASILKAKELLKKNCNLRSIG